MAAVLGFVVGVGFLAIVAVAGVLDALDAFGDHSVEDHQGCGGVLEAGHYFGIVRHGYLWPVAFREVADHQRSFIVERIYALHTGVMGQAPLVVVTEDRGQGLANVGRVEQVAETGHRSHILADQLIDKTAVAHLELWVQGVLGAHSLLEALGNFLLRNGANMLHVVFAVEEILIDPAASAFKQTVAVGREGRVAHSLGHAGHGAEGGQVPGGAHGVGAVELDIVGIVLDAVKDAGFALVPAAGAPGVGEGAFGGGPLSAEPCIVAGEGPVEVEVDDLAHLAVGGGSAPVLEAERELVAEVHVAIGIGGVAEVGFTHGAGEGGEEELGGYLVVPDMGAGAEAEAVLVAAALEAVEAAVGDAEAGVGDQGGEVGGGGVFDGGGEGGLGEGGGEGAGAGFELRQVGGDVLGDGPGVRELGAIVVAEEGVLLAGGGFPAAAGGGSVGEVPGEKEAEGAG